MLNIKNYDLFKFFLILFIFFNFINAQTEAEKKDLQGVLVKVLNSSESEDYQTAAALIVYTGDDSNRNLKDTYKFSNPKEKSKVKRLAKKIKAFQDLSDSYSVGSITKNSNPAGDLYLVDVSFNSGKQSLTTVFTFAIVKNSFKLVKIK